MWVWGEIEGKDDAEVSILKDWVNINAITKKYNPEKEILLFCNPQWINGFRFRVSAAINIVTRHFISLNERTQHPLVLPRDWR